MQYSRFSIFFVAILLSIKVLAIEINSTAGQLSTLVDDLGITSLKVTGSINATDLHFINNQLSDLTSLDLSDATIEACEGERLLSGLSSFAANAIPPYAFMGTKLTNVVLPANLESIDESAFASTGITAINIPATVTTIGASAFTGCEALTSITIPEAANNLGSNIFSGCKSLKTVNILSHPTEIPARMFYGCSSLKSIQIPLSVTAIGDNAFSGASGLYMANFPTGLTTIGNYAFYDTAIREVNLTECSQLKTVGDFAFANCTNLTTIELSNAITELGHGVLFDDDALLSVTLPADTKIIPEFTFKGTSNLDPKTELPASVSEIGDYALTGWSNRQQITLPDNLSYIGEGAMADWSSLSEIDASKVQAVPSLGEDVWQNVDPEQVTVYVSEPNLEDFRSAPQWSEFSIKTRSTDSQTNVIEVEESCITIGFNGEILRITSNTEPIAEVILYDLAGRRRFTLNGAPEMSVNINVKAIGSETFIVSATLTDGNNTTAKISVK